MDTSGRPALPMLSSDSLGWRPTYTIADVIHAVRALCLGHRGHGVTNAVPLPASLYAALQAQLAAQDVALDTHASASAAASGIAKSAVLPHAAHAESAVSAASGADAAARSSIDESDGASRSPISLPLPSSESNHALLLQSPSVADAARLSLGKAWHRRRSSGGSETAGAADTAAAAAAAAAAAGASPRAQADAAVSSFAGEGMLSPGTGGMVAAGTLFFGSARRPSHVREGSHGSHGSHGAVAGGSAGSVGAANGVHSSAGGGLGGTPRSRRMSLPSPLTGTQRLRAGSGTSSSLLSPLSYGGALSSLSPKKERPGLGELGRPVLPLSFAQLTAAGSDSEPSLSSTGAGGAGGAGGTAGFGLAGSVGTTVSSSALAGASSNRRASTSSALDSARAAAMLQLRSPGTVSPLGTAALILAPASASSSTSLAAATAAVTPGGLAVDHRQASAASAFHPAATRTVSLSLPQDVSVRCGHYALRGRRPTMEDRGLYEPRLTIPVATGRSRRGRTSQSTAAVRAGAGSTSGFSGESTAAAADNVHLRGVGASQPPSELAAMPAKASSAVTVADGSDTDTQLEAEPQHVLLAALMDGHGGTKAADFVAYRLPMLLAAYLRATTTEAVDGGAGVGPGSAVSATDASGTSPSRARSPIAASAAAARSSSASMRTPIVLPSPAASVHSGGASSRRNRTQSQSHRRYEGTSTGSTNGSQVDVGEALYRACLRLDWEFEHLLLWARAETSSARDKERRASARSSTGSSASGAAAPTQAGAATTHSGRRSSLPAPVTAGGGLAGAATAAPKTTTPTPVDTAGASSLELDSAGRTPLLTPLTATPSASRARLSDGGGHGASAPPAVGGADLLKAFAGVASDASESLIMDGTAAASGSVTVTAPASEALPVTAAGGAPASSSGISPAISPADATPSSSSASGSTPTPLTGASSSSSSASSTAGQALTLGTRVPGTGSGTALPAVTWEELYARAFLRMSARVDASPPPVIVSSTGRVRTSPSPLLQAQALVGTSPATTVPPLLVSPPAQATDAAASGEVLSLASPPFMSTSGRAAADTLSPPVAAVLRGDTDSASGSGSDNGSGGKAGAAAGTAGARGSSGAAADTVASQQFRLSPPPFAMRLPLPAPAPAPPSSARSDGEASSRQPARWDRGADETARESAAAHQERILRFMLDAQGSAGITGSGANQAAPAIADFSGTAAHQVAGAALGGVQAAAAEPQAALPAADLAQAVKAAIRVDVAAAPDASRRSHLHAQMATQAGAGGEGTAQAAASAVAPHRRVLSLPLLMRRAGAQKGAFADPEALDDTSGCTLIAVVLSGNGMPPPPKQWRLARTARDLMLKPSAVSMLQRIDAAGEAPVSTTGIAIDAAGGAAQAVWPHVTATIACVGDSRAVLCRGGFAVDLSVDHRTDRQEERARILAAGGMLIRGRVLGRLAVTRAIGDLSLKRGARDMPLVSGEPELFQVPLLLPLVRADAGAAVPPTKQALGSSSVGEAVATLGEAAADARPTLHQADRVSAAGGQVESPKSSPALHSLQRESAASASASASASADTSIIFDEFIVLACDGVFDVWSSQLAVSAVRYVLQRGGTPATAAAQLVHGALALGSNDNCSAIVLRVGAGPAPVSDSTAPEPSPAASAAAVSASGAAVAHGREGVASEKVLLQRSQGFLQFVAAVIAVAEQAQAAVGAGHGATAGVGGLTPVASAAAAGQGQGHRLRPRMMPSPLTVAHLRQLHASFARKIDVLRASIASPKGSSSATQSESARSAGSISSLMLPGRRDSPSAAAAKSSMLGTGSVRMPPSGPLALTSGLSSSFAMGAELGQLQPSKLEEPFPGFYSGFAAFIMRESGAAAPLFGSAAGSTGAAPLAAASPSAAASASKVLPAVAAASSKPTAPEAHVVAPVAATAGEAPVLSAAAKKAARGPNPFGRPKPAPAQPAKGPSAADAGILASEIPAAAPTGPLTASSSAVSTGTAAPVASEPTVTTGSSGESAAAKKSRRGPNPFARGATKTHVAAPTAIPGPTLDTLGRVSDEASLTADGEAASSAHLAAAAGPVSALAPTALSPSSPAEGAQGAVQGDSAQAAAAGAVGGIAAGRVATPATSTLVHPVAVGRKGRGPNPFARSHSKPQSATSAVGLAIDDSDNMSGSAASVSGMPVSARSVGAAASVGQHVDGSAVRPAASDAPNVSATASSRKGRDASTANDGLPGPLHSESARSAASDSESGSQLPQLAVVGTGLVDQDASADKASHTPTSPRHDAPSHSPRAPLASGPSPRLLGLGALSRASGGRSPRVLGASSPRATVLSASPRSSRSDLAGPLSSSPRLAGEPTLATSPLAPLASTRTSSGSVSPRHESAATRRHAPEIGHAISPGHIKGTAATGTSPASESIDVPRPAAVTVAAPVPVPPASPAGVSPLGSSPRARRATGLLVASGASMLVAGSSSGSSNLAPQRRRSVPGSAAVSGLSQSHCAFPTSGERPGAAAAAPYPGPSSSPPAATFSSGGSASPGKITVPPEMPGPLTGLTGLSQSAAAGSINATSSGAAAPATDAVAAAATYRVLQAVAAADLSGDSGIRRSGERASVHSTSSSPAAPSMVAASADAAHGHAMPQPRPRHSSALLGAGQSMLSASTHTGTPQSATAASASSRPARSAELAAAVYGSTRSSVGLASGLAHTGSHCAASGSSASAASPSHHQHQHRDEGRHHRDTAAATSPSGTSSPPLRQAPSLVRAYASGPPASAAASASVGGTGIGSGSHGAAALPPPASALTMRRSGSAGSTSSSSGGGPGSPSTPPDALDAAVARQAVRRNSHA